MLNNLSRINLLKRLSALLLLCVSGSGLAQTYPGQAPWTAEQAKASVSPWALQIRQARQLLAAGKAERAHQRLAELESQAAGDIEFDYWLGVTALDTQRFGIALFSLERVLLLEPTHHGARLAFARALYGLGEFDAAETEFKRLRAAKPPPGARAVIDDYLRRLFQGPSFSMGLKLEGGYDSNANSGASINSFLGFNLSDSSQETETAYGKLQLTGGMSWALSKTVSWETQLKASGSSYTRAHFVDSDDFAANTGLVLEDGGSRYFTRIGSSHGRLDDDFNNRSYRLEIGGQHGLSARWSLDWVLRGAQLRYADSLNARDVNQAIGALVLSRAMSWDGVLGVATIAGNDHALQSNSSFDRRLYATRLFATGPLWAEMRWQLLGDYSRSDYQRPFAGLDRDDRQWHFALSLPVTLDKHWILQPQASYRRNESSVELFSYDQVQLGISLQGNW